MFFLEFECSFHRGQLIVQDGLRMVDQWLAAHTKVTPRLKYYSCIAKLVHTWRDNPRKFFDMYVQEFSAAEALACGAATLPAKCIAGRWGSIAQSEADLFKAGTDRVRKVLQLVCEQRADSRPALQDAQAAVGSELAEPALEEYQEYKKRLGRWRQDTVQLCREPCANVWWQVFNIMRLVHGPTTHLFNFLLDRKYINERGSHLAHLTCGKAAAIFEEFSSLIKNHFCWANQILGDSQATDMEKQELLAFGVLMVGNHATGFHRRIVEPTTRRRSQSPVRHFLFTD